MLDIVYMFYRICQEHSEFIEHISNICQFQSQDVFAKNDAAVTVVLFP